MSIRIDQHIHGLKIREDHTSTYINSKRPTPIWFHNYETAYAYTIPLYNHDPDRVMLS
jgi:hypothetical protein